MAADRPMTKVEFAAQQLRQRILAGDVLPGTRLRAEHLTTDLEMSPTPIREALRVLQAEGLVEHTPNHGMTVARISVQDLREICDIRKVLEGHALEVAISKMESKTLARLENLQKEFAAATAKGDAAAAMALNHDWHFLIYHTAGSARLEEHIQRLWTAYPWRAVGALSGWPTQSVDEHNQIMDAIRVRDIEFAVKCLRDHISRGEEGLTDRVRELLSSP